MARPRLFLHDSVGPGRRPANRSGDVIAVKQRLSNLGFYQPPPEGFGDDIDAGFNAAVRAFQTDNGLQIDGRLEPGGETERNLAAFDDDAPEEAGFALEDLALSGRVGARGENAKEDVTQVKQALAELGRYPLDRTSEPPPFVDTKLVDAIRELQRDQGLTEDGFIDPDGETLDALKKSEGRPGTRPGETEVAIARALVLAAPYVLHGLRVAAPHVLRALGGMGLGAAGGQAVIEAAKTKGADPQTENPKMDAARPQSPLPPPPEEPPKVENIEKFPGVPIQLPTHTGFPIPDEPEMLIEIFPDDSERFSIPFILENGRGNKTTQGELTDGLGAATEVAKEENLEMEHIGGARDSEGIDKKEFYLPNAITGGRLGSNRTDFAMKNRKTGRQIHVNTIDTYADNETPTSREFLAAVSIIFNLEAGHTLVLLPKSGEGWVPERKAFKEFLRPIIKELAKPIPKIEPRTSNLEPRNHRKNCGKYFSLRNRRRGPNVTCKRG
jgi:peptidoglycan hydrolase-like protein with peptidoglycan-binding domain